MEQLTMQFLWLDEELKIWLNIELQETVGDNLGERKASLEL